MATRPVDPRYSNLPGLGLIEAARAAKVEREKQAHLAKLTKLRQSQVDMAKGYVFSQKGQPSLRLGKTPEDSPEVVVFSTIVAAFSTAEKVLDPKTGRVTQSTTKVAVEAAAVRLPALIADPSTQEDALRGVEWAEQALRWAGNQIFRNKKKTGPKTQETTVVASV